MRRILRSIAAASFLALGALASVPAIAQDAQVSTASTLPGGPSVAAPYGFVVMCRDGANRLCDRALEPVARMDRTAGFDAQFALLDKVNRAVNGSVEQRTDLSVLRVDDHWNRPVKTAIGMTGDCEDIAIEKTERLLDAGFAAENLYFAIVYRRDVGLHAVLVAHTDRGDYVLDSRSPWVEPWTKAPYQWVKRQSAENPQRWEMISPTLVEADAAPRITLADNSDTYMRR